MKVAFLSRVAILCVSTTIVELASRVVKPVVPKFCEQLCNETVGCCSYFYMASDLSCYLVTDKALLGSSQEELNSLNDAKNIVRRYVKRGMTCPNDVKINNSETKTLQCTQTGGGVSIWGRWRQSSCMPCGLIYCRKYTRDRSCTKPKPSFGSENCTEALTETKPGRKCKPAGGYRILKAGDETVQVKRHEIERSWMEAEQVCQLEGGSLVKVDTPEKQAAIAYKISHPKDQFRKFSMWIGLKDLNKDNTYKWTDGSPLVYSKWKYREPSLKDASAEDCVLLLRYVGSVYWMNRHCLDKNGFICERP